MCQMDGAVNGEARARKVRGEGGGGRKTVEGRGRVVKAPIDNDLHRDALPLKK